MLVNWFALGSFVKWDDFNLIVSGVLNFVHPVGNIFSEPTSVRMNCSPFPVGIVDMFVLINH